MQPTVWSSKQPHVTCMHAVHQESWRRRQTNSIESRPRAFNQSTGISSEIRTKLRDWVAWQARAGCYSQAALSSNDSKTLYLSDTQSPASLVRPALGCSSHFLSDREALCNGSALNQRMEWLLRQTSLPSLSFH